MQPRQRTILLRTLGMALIGSLVGLGAFHGRATESTGEQTLDSHQKMLEALRGLSQRTPVRDPILGETQVRRLRAELAALAKKGTTEDLFPQVTRWQLHFELGTAELFLGNESQTIDQLTEAYKLLPQVSRLLRPDLPIRLQFQLGLAYLRWGETQNCCLRRTPDSCILPIRKGGIHTKPEGSEQAIAYFKQVLDKSEVGSTAHLEARWLLNIAYMTLGNYPAGLPKRYLIPPEAFKSEEQFPSFHNVAAGAGLNTFSLAGGACSEDFNNDGYVDLMVSTWDPSGQIRFFQNRGDGTFSDKTQTAGLIGLYGGLNMVQADYDNDGHVDVFVLRGAWMGDSDQHPNSLLHNNGDGTFTDVTFDAGLAKVHYPTQTAAWADYDNDGDLDLYIGNEATYKGIFLPQSMVDGQSDRLRYPCQLFRNNGDETFVDVAEQAGVTNDRWTKGVVWGDYDGDGFSDLYVSNFLEPNRLYHNNQDGTFTDVAEKLGVTQPIASFPSWFWDFDNDGVQDLFVSAYAAGIADLAAASLNLPFQAELARLYRGDGRGGFEEVSRQRNLTQPTAPMGSNFGDLDNDGYLDFYLGTGYPDYKDLMPNVMYRNQGGKRFVDVSTTGGFSHLQKGHAVVFADFDNDGDQDIFEQMGGALGGDKFWDVLYQNPGCGNHWIAVELRGIRSNRSGIGARIRLDLEENGQSRTIFKSVNSGGSFGANPLRQTIGLGQAEIIKRLEIFWPTTGEKQVFLEVPRDQFIRIVEGEREYQRLSVRKSVLGHPSKDKKDTLLFRQELIKFDNTR